MAKTNLEVAKAFVTGGRPCKGSNTLYTKVHFDGQDTRVFTSYSTDVAMIRDGILWYHAYRSLSTQRQLSYVRSAWHGHTLQAGEKTMEVPFVHHGAGTTNVEDYVHRAMNALNELLTPRIRETTRVRHWDTFLRRMALTEKLLTLPCYGAPPTEAVLTRLAIARSIRDCNDANPAGLKTIITRVRAIHALEGEMK